MDNDAPGLEVGFTIDTGPSEAAVARLEGRLEDATARVLRDAELIERATSGMVQLGGAVTELNSFGNAADRATQASTVAFKRTEKEIEGLIRSIEKRTAVEGLSRDQQLALRVEHLATAAAMQKNADAAGRLSVAYAELTGRQAETAERNRVAAADREERALRQVNDQLREREKLEALLHDNFSVGRQTAVQGGATFSALAERERALELAQQEVARQRELNNVLAERASIQAALERGTGVGRGRATDNGATFSALAARAAEEEAQAQLVAANAARRAADEHARLAEMVRGSHAAQMADAEAAEALRVATDPLYAATKRLNTELAESTRLYHAGATAPAEYARQQQVLQDRLQAVTQQHELSARAARGNGFAMRQVAIQLPDIVQGLLTGQKPFQVFIQQGGQIAQIGMMAEGGLKGFAGQLGRLGLAFAPVAAAAAVAGVAIWRWQSQLENSAGLKAYADGLGLTHKEMKKLGEVSLTTGDLLAGLSKTVSDGFSLDGTGKRIMDALFSPNDAKEIRGFVASIYGVFVGGYNAITDLWAQIAPAVSEYVSAAAKSAAAFFKPMIDAAKWAADGISGIFKTVYDWVAGWVQRIGGAIAPVLQATGNSQAASALSSAGAKLGKAFGGAYSKATQDFINGSNAFVARVGANAVQAAQKRLTAKANEIKADRTPKVDRHAEQLQRDADAIEAQIRNLYRLADAYKVSDAAALVAEARVKSESKAIRQRGDVEAAVVREVRLAIAQRVSEAAKADASTRAQASAQGEVNRMVAAGLVPVERANELLRDRLADLPLLAALEVAQQRGMTAEAQKITQALDDQRVARERLRKEQQTAAFQSATQAGADRLDELREELRLIGATDMARTKALAGVRATQQARNFNPDDRGGYVQQQMLIAEQQQRLTDAQNDYNQALSYTADLFDTIDQSALSAARGMSDAFGSVGSAIGDLLTNTTNYYATDERLRLERERRIREAGGSEAAIARENRLYALRSSSLQVNAFGNMAQAAKGFFREGSAGWKAVSTAEKAARAVEFALSVKAIAQDAVETGSKLASSAARTASNAVEAVTKAISSLPFPANLAAGAATVAALAAIGVSVAGGFGGGKNTLPKANNGTGTVLGDPEAQSASVRRAIDALREVNLLNNGYSREMAGYLRSIEGQIGGVAAQIVRAGNVNADVKVNEGFQKNLIGSVLSKIPLIGGILGGLFGSKTEVVGSGLYGKSQSLGSILSAGFDASYYSDTKKTSKFLGITTGTKYSTSYTAADAGLEKQFTLILRDFNDAIAAAAGPLGASTDAIKARLSSFVVSIGKIDLKGLTGAQIEEKLTAIFGAAADQMADAAFPGIARFQKVGEGVFETLVRMSSTVEAVTTTLDQLGLSARALGIDAKLGIAAQFDSLSDMQQVADAYFQAFYTPAEQNAAKLKQLGVVISGLGVAMPDTLAAFRALVEAQDLTTAAGQATYATLLQLAPAFADLKQSMEGAKTAADILAERQGLERQLLELAGDTAALRALDLQKIDVSNRALQEQVWAVQDAQAAAKAAEELRQAWASVGDSIMDEVRRIRGLSATDTSLGFSALMGQFNAATAAARGGDQDAAKSLPGLSQALLKAAGDAASSRQELDRVQAQVAASLEATLASIAKLGLVTGSNAAANMAAAMQTAPGASTPSVAGGLDLAAEIVRLREEVSALRSENNAGHAATAGYTRGVKQKLDDVTGASGGDAISVVQAAA